MGNLEPQGAIAIAAWNAPDHTTIVGEEELVAKAQLHAISLGAEVAAVDIAGPWHCRLAEHTAKRIGARAIGHPLQFSECPDLHEFHWNDRVRSRDHAAVFGGARI